MQNMIPLWMSKFTGWVGGVLAVCLPLAAQTVNLEATPAPMALKIQTSAGSAPALSWPVLDPGWAVTLQYRGSLSTGPWLRAPNPTPWPSVATTWTETAASESSSRFYRLLTVPAADRGKIHSATLIQTYSKADLTSLLKLLGVNLTPQYGARIHKVVYETVSPWGARTQASGILALPDPPVGKLPLASYQHGTIAARDEAPSASPMGERYIAAAFASVGYAVVMADYLGLGDSSSIHPYHHARSEATAAVDLLRASRTYGSTNQIALNGQLFLFGYSQGGHATAALHRELEEYHQGEFAITASAPMAGAYDLSGTTTEDFLDGSAAPNPYYFAILLAAYQDVYQIAGSLAELLIPPYDKTLPPLLDGQHTGSEINDAMPSNPVQILRPEVLAAFKQSTDHPLRQALRENDLLQWAPQAPTRLYHCGGDRDVAPANSQVALQHFQANGSTNVTLVVPSATADHGGCVLPSLLLALDWFNSLKGKP